MTKKTAKHLEWDDSMSMGVAYLDEDHRKIFSLIKKLTGSDSGRMSAHVVEEVLDVLLNYTGYHFAREEEYMRKIGYPDLEEHIVAHFALSRKVEALRLRFFLGERDSVGQETLDLLGDWPHTHILQEDMKYKDFRQHSAPELSTLA
ncbi:MAG: hemerythrin family protein [Burkholderiales bacterium]